MNVSRSVTLVGIHGVNMTTKGACGTSASVENQEKGNDPSSTHRRSHIAGRISIEVQRWMRHQS